MLTVFPISEVKLLLFAPPSGFPLLALIPTEGEAVVLPLYLHLKENVYATPVVNPLGKIAALAVFIALVIVYLLTVVD